MTRNASAKAAGTRSVFGGGGEGNVEPCRRGENVVVEVKQSSNSRSAAAIIRHLYLVFGSGFDFTELLTALKHQLSIGPDKDALTERGTNSLIG
jgi:hypothetical protein